MTTAEENQRLVATLRDVEPHLGHELRAAQRHAPGSTWEHALQVTIAVLREARGRWLTIPVVAWPTAHGLLHLLSETTTPPPDAIEVELGRWIELQQCIAKLVLVWVEHGSTSTGRRFVCEALEELLDHEAELRR